MEQNSTKPDPTATIEALEGLLLEWCAWHYQRFGDKAVHDGAPISATTRALVEIHNLRESR